MRSIRRNAHKGLPPYHSALRALAKFDAETRFRIPAGCTCWTSWVVPESLPKMRPPLILGRSNLFLGQSFHPFRMLLLVFSLIVI